METEMTPRSPIPEAGGGRETLRFWVRTRTWWKKMQARDRGVVAGKGTSFSPSNTSSCLVHGPYRSH